jgi:hypothetical protein
MALASPEPVFSTLIEIVVVSPSWIIDGEVDFGGVKSVYFPS